MLCGPAYKTAGRLNSSAFAVVYEPARSVAEVADADLPVASVAVSEMAAGFAHRLRRKKGIYHNVMRNPSAHPVPPHTRSLPACHCSSGNGSSSSSTSSTSDTNNHSNDDDDDDDADRANHA